MAVTTVYTYDLNGSKKDFDVPFEYLARRFVQVTLIGQDRKPLDLASDFRFIGKTSIQTLKAWGPADGYERIEIRRNTSATDRLVDFADGSILRATELNTSQVQTMHVAEEARNMVADTISENADGELDARGRRLANLADGVDPGHAVTLRQQIAWGESALNQANRATLEANRATSQANAAAAHKSAAFTSESNALTYQNSALAYRDAAAAHKNAAFTSESNAWAHRQAAESYKNAAFASESNAWAHRQAAESYKNAAAASAASAAGSAAAVNMPSASGQAGKMLRQKLDGSGLEYVPSFYEFGIGWESAQAYGSVGDWRPNGVYHVNTANVSGAPAGNGVLTTASAPNDRSFRCLQYASWDGRLLTCTMANGVWTAWKETWTTANFNPASYQLALGYVPVRSNTWSEAVNHIGYNPAEGCLTAQTDATYWGAVWTSRNAMTFLASSSVLGAIGTYAFLRNGTGGTVYPGVLYAGSALFYGSSNPGEGGTPASGTWRCMGNGTSTSATLFVRVF